MPKVLFVTYGGGHAEIVNLLIQENKKSPRYEPVVLALTSAGTYFQDRNVSHITCRDMVDELGIGILMRVGEELAREFWVRGGPVSFEESAAYLGISMADLVTEIGEDEAHALYAEKGRAAFCPTRFMGQVLDYIDPDVVVTTCHVRMEKAAILAAQSRRTISVTIDDLFGINLYSKGPDGGAVPAGEWPNYYVVLNDFVAARVAELGMPAERIQALGQPVFSLWQSMTDSQLDMPADAVARDCWPYGARKFLYIATSREDILEAQVSMLVKAVPSDAHCVIKLHPSTSDKRFNALCPDLPPTISVTSTANSYALVRACDVAITHQSTLGVYCLVAGVPLLTIDDPFENSHAIYEDFGFSTRIADQTALNKALSGADPVAAKGRLNVPGNASADINAFLSLLGAVE